MNAQYAVSLVVSALIGYYVYQDATKRKLSNAVAWGILSFLFGLLGFLVYYLKVMRKDLHGTSKK